MAPRDVRFRGDSKFWVVSQFEFMAFCPGSRDVGSRTILALWAAKSLSIEVTSFTSKHTGPGSKRALENLDRFSIARNLPYSEDKTQREQLIAEAMAIVDTLLDAPHKKKQTPR